MSNMMNTGQIGAALGLTIPVETLKAAGLTEAGREKRAILWEEDWPTICDKLSAYIASKGKKRPAAPPPPAPRVKKAKQEELPINGEDEDDEL